MKKLIVAFVLLIGTTVVHADEKECLLAAFKDYNEANLAILSRAPVIPTIETRMAQRRLEERYCLREARCFVDPNRPGMSGPFAVEFDRCLDDEAEERLKNRVK